MDILQQPLRFKVGKTVRYISLYGLRRTISKVEAELHLRRHYDRLPSLPLQARPGRHVGIIGAGKYSYGNIGHYLVRNYGHVIQAAMDPNIHRAASLFEKYRLNYYTDDSDRLFADPAIDLIFVVSNHASHAEYAIKALEAGKSVHIEKPHITDESQLERLCDSMSRFPGKVNLGFTRPESRLGRQVRRHLEGQSGPIASSWFIVGHELPPGHWYLNEGEGGRILGNVCHWTDFVYSMSPEETRYPITIRAAGSVDSDCVLTYILGDGSLSTITFSEKREPFEGVREKYIAHRGHALMLMEDFRRLTVEVQARKYVYASRFRDHGTEDSIRRSFEMVQPVGNTRDGCSIQYVWETGQLMLKSRDALVTGKDVVVSGGHPLRSRLLSCS